MNRDDAYQTVLNIKRALNAEAYSEFLETVAKYRCGSHTKQEFTDRMHTLLPPDQLKTMKPFMATEWKARYKRKFHDDGSPSAKQDQKKAEALPSNEERAGAMLNHLKADQRPEKKARLSPNIAVLRAIDEQRRPGPVGKREVAMRLLVEHATAQNEVPTFAEDDPAALRRALSAAIGLLDFKNRRLEARRRQIDGADSDEDRLPEEML